MKSKFFAGRLLKKAKRSFCKIFEIRAKAWYHKIYHVLKKWHRNYCKRIYNIIDKEVELC